MPVFLTGARDPAHIRLGLALVDYDNVCKPKRDTKAEIESHTESLVSMLAYTFRQVFSRMKELDIRFYGGWIDKDGLHSHKAIHILEIMPALRGRRRGLIVRPSLALTMIRFPDMVPKGTVRYRERQRRGQPRREQKMVDTMLGFDAAFAAEDSVIGVGIVADDDDHIPAALSAHAARAAPVVWLRHRAVGSGMNDRAMMDRGLRVCRLKDEEHDSLA